MATFLQEISNALTSIISMVGSVVDALLGTDGALAPIFPFVAFGVAVSVLMLGLSVLFKSVWGK